MNSLGWVALLAYVTYRRTWGACDCDALRRRLRVEQNQRETWEHIARELFFENRELRDRLPRSTLNP